MTANERAANIADDVIVQSDRYDCDYYQGDLRQRCDDEALTENERACLKTLAAIASYHSKYEDAGSPYGPLIQTADGRSPIPSDMVEDELQELKTTVQYLNPSVLRARVFDVLWLRSRDPKHAWTAIQEFLTCAKTHFDIEHWTYCAEYAERALRLAALFRRKEAKYFKSVYNLLLSWVRDYSAEDKKFLTARSISLLLDFGSDDTDELLSIAKESAERAENEGDFHRAEEYWKLAVQAARKSKNEDEVNQAQASLAETLASNARNLGGGMSAAHWMQQAVEAYKAVPGSKKRRDELYGELLEFQAQSLNEMGKFETPIDMSSCIAQTVETISGKTFREALFAFAFGVTKVPDYKSLEKQAEELAHRFPLSQLFGAVHLDGEGKVIAKSGGSFETGAVTNHNLYRYAALEHQVSVAGCILPAADILRVEHPISLTELESLTANNPFIAPSQQRMWAQGLIAGLNEDYEIALPIIVPLLENSLRHVLKSFGERVSTLNTHGVQEELRITAILDHETTLEVFGYDLVMDLKGLLLERTYGNLRNKVAHGLGVTGTYYSATAIYLWWLCFRLVLTPYAKQLSSPETTEI
ncbi:DUF4209 domain-containing protein [Alteromonas gilva]|uniref:DUF4209 domain-containing protein n=1 Tax=Alteromonas gilva TaxID=2987522 RepID=A0ABT5L8V7_9ALTE|nr:DUF4209 domain-containing protein [Alteromonas gilva]MDC8832956.1 DUF4209 domain-containing protein [Alteromonas gilva]